MQDFTMSRLRSSDNMGDLAVYTMLPQGKEPIGIVQISHGMTEHIGRYKLFANELCDAGFIVVANDHIGHGLTSDYHGMDGHFGGKNSHLLVLCDLRNVMHMTKEQYPGLPYFMLGHSMGSFFARTFAFTYKKDVDKLSGLIISGTAGPNRKRKAAALMTNFLCFKDGEEALSPRMDLLLLQGFNDNFGEIVTGVEWLTRDKEIQNIYIKDKKCTFKFTVSSYRELIKINGTSNTARYIARTPQDLPVLFISGDKDPVGGNGTGVKNAYKLYEEAGVKDLTLKLYEGARHELLNETNREEVVEYLLNWLSERLA